MYGSFDLSICYGCNEAFKDGERFIGYFENYMHVKCAPVHILETSPCSYVWPLVKKQD